jgi:NADPH-dependent 2,4-dienoyl-CoA reductase/sulfur reductase-like enzyme/nitrite reductase/ring-hydroxylating ferredoxin subunit
MSPNNQHRNGVEASESRVDSLNQSWADQTVFTDKYIYSEEQIRIFKNIWVPVCHESELPEPYDFRTSSIANENIIICRAPDGKINALLNVCPHRGMLIERRPQGSFMEGQASGNPKRITCMFHAWQFDMRGNCVYVAREKEGYQDRFCKDDAGLRRLRCEVNYGGLVWVNMSDQPPIMLEDWVGEAFEPVRKAINFEPLEVFHYHKTIVDKNYKLNNDERIKFKEQHPDFNYKETNGENFTSPPTLSLLNFGHAVMQTKQQESKSLPSTDLCFPCLKPGQSFNVELFPGFSFTIDGPVLNVSTITPLSESEVLLEHRGFAPKSDSVHDRKKRTDHYNSRWGPFKLGQIDNFQATSESDATNSRFLNHYRDEWSRWMDQHPDSQNRLVDAENPLKRPEQKEESAGLTSPHIVIVGASHAGIAFGDKLRKNGFEGQITMFDRQVGGPMERPPLSKGFLLGGGETVESKSLLRQKKWYKTQKIKLKTQSNVEHIDLDKKTVTVNQGDKIHFDKLVIASGAIPRELPATEGMGNTFTLRQPSDANAIRQTANNSDSVVIIGGGYIGLEVAASLNQKGMTVTVIEAADRILARVASKPLADHLTELHDSNGVSIVTGVGVQDINQEDGIFESVTLANGQTIKGDMLITGIGVLPDSKLAADAGLETLREGSGPILVDDMMQTSHKDVMAIGDVALRRSQTMAVESVHNAQETAAVAASTITGVAPPIIQTPWFWSDQYDAKLQSVGIVPVLDEEAYQVTRLGKRDGGVSFWTYKGTELIAVEVVNDPATYMEARQCLETQQSPDPNQISNPLFSPIDSGGARS